MSTPTPRCVYCSKPTRSHAVAIAPSAYAAAYDDPSFDADQGTYVAMVCHECWADRNAAVFEELADAPAGRPTDDEGLSRASRDAVREMDHDHVRFELAE